MKKRAREESTPVPRIYHDGLLQVAQESIRESVAPLLPTFSSLRSSLYRKRHQRLPPLPRSVDDLSFDGDWSKTLNGEDFMLGSRDGVFLFSTSNNLAILAEASTLYMDGTFQICPRLFYQVFTVHAPKRGQQFPLAYFLLPGKSREVYNTSFMHPVERGSAEHRNPARPPESTD